MGYDHRKTNCFVPEFLRSAPLASALRPLRHILHVVILIFGWMLGTCIFYAIEVPAEHQVCQLPALRFPVPGSGNYIDILGSGGHICAIERCLQDHR